MDDIIREEKDLVLLLGSFLVYKQVNNLYDLVKYIESYSSNDIFSIVSLVKEHLSLTNIQWFGDFLLAIKDESSLITLLSIPVDYSLISNALKFISPECLNSFIQFWSDVNV